MGTPVSLCCIALFLSAFLLISHVDGSTTEGNMTVDMDMTTSMDMNYTTVMPTTANMTSAENMTSENMTMSSSETSSMMPMTQMMTSQTSMAPQSTMAPQTSMATQTTMAPITTRTTTMAPVVTTRPLTTTTTKTTTTVRTTTPPQVFSTAEPSKFGTRGLPAFAISLALALIFGTALLVLLVRKYCKSKKYKPESNVPDSRRDMPGMVLSMPMENAFGPDVTTVDLEDENEARKSKEVIGNGTGVSTFATNPSAENLAHGASTGSLGLTSNPEWFKVEPSAGASASRESLSSAERLLAGKESESESNKTESNDPDKDKVDTAEEEDSEVKLTPPSDSEPEDEETNI